MECVTNNSHKINVQTTLNSVVKWDHEKTFLGISNFDITDCVVFLLDLKEHGIPRIKYTLYPVYAVMNFQRLLCYFLN